MRENEKLLQKADIAVSDLESNGGKLSVEQSGSFIRKLLVQPTMLGQVRRVVMSAPERNVNKIQFASRIMRPGVSNTALSAGDRAKPTTEKITLTTKEVIAEINLPYDVIEDNIERGNIGTMTGGAGDASGGLKDTIMTLIAERAAIDLEELAILGDTGSTDAYLALTNGWLSRLTANVVDAAGSPVSRRLFTDGMKTLPSQYRRNRAALGHWVSTENEIDYRETIAQRETAAGDAQTRNTDAVFAAGAPVGGVGLMPSAQGILTNPLNLLFGIQRDVHVETDKDIRARTYIIVLTARVDFQVEEEEAAVKYQNVGSV